GSASSTARLRVGIIRAATTGRATSTRHARWCQDRDRPRATRWHGRTGVCCMANIVGLCGSLRRGSFNAALLRAAAMLAPEGSRIDARTLHGVPLYDGDMEAAEGIPPAVAALKDAVAAADGLLLATPEYNNGIPGVFKNAIDWMSRPAADIARVFGGKPVAVIGA